MKCPIKYTPNAVWKYYLCQISAASKSNFTINAFHPVVEYQLKKTGTIPKRLTTKPFNTSRN